jgi:hypothetical protein
VTWRELMKLVPSMRPITTARAMPTERDKRPGMAQAILIECYKTARQPDLDTEAPLSVVEEAKQALRG